MKKRFGTLTLALILACSLAAPAGAVVAQEPTTAAPSERMNNHNYTNELLTVTAYNVISKGTMAYKSGTTIEKYTMSGTGATANTKHFYLKFHAPVNVTGTIARG